jgi:hypothetical protein
MGQKSSNAVQVDAQQDPSDLVPQDAQFWQRYSPHHEFPLSSAASIALHVLAIALLVVGGILAAKWGLGESDKPLPLSILDDPGGGGQPAGLPTGTGGQGAIQPKETAAADSKDTTVAQAPSIPKEELDQPKVDPLELPKLNDPSVRWIDESNEALQGLKDLDKAVRQRLFDGLSNPSKGKGGSGTGGGKGAGQGTGTGSGTAPGEGTLSKRQKRQLRWEINFRVNGPEDHLRQFAALGAILAVPLPNGTFQVFRDLNRRPPIGRVEDLAHLNRIWWSDRNPDTIMGLSQVLRVRPGPVLFAFFPQSLEERLAQMEKEYRGQQNEELIQEKMRFQVVPSGGSYEVVVDRNQ